MPVVSSPIRLVDNLHETTQLEGSSWAQGKTGHGLLLTSRMAIITCRNGMDLAGQMNMEMFSVKSHLQKKVKRRLDRPTGSRNPAPKRDFRSGCSRIPEFRSCLLRSAW